MKKIKTFTRTSVHEVGSHISSQGRSVTFQELGKPGGFFGTPDAMPAGIDVRDGAVLRVTVTVEQIRPGKRVWNPFADRFNKRSKKRVGRGRWES